MGISRKGAGNCIRSVKPVLGEEDFCFGVKLDRCCDRSWSVAQVMCGSDAIVKKGSVRGYASSDRTIATLRT